MINVWGIIMPDDLRTFISSQIPSKNVIRANKDLPEAAARHKPSLINICGIIVQMIWVRLLATKSLERMTNETQK